MEDNSDCRVVKENIKECDKEHIGNIKHFFFVGSKSKAIRGKYNFHWILC